MSLILTPHALCRYVHCQVALRVPPLRLLYLDLYSEMGLALMPQPICLLISFFLAWPTMNQFRSSTSHLFSLFKSQAINPLYEITHFSHYFGSFCCFIWSSVSLNVILHSSSNASQQTLFFKNSPPSLLPVKKKKKIPCMLSYFRGCLLYVCALFFKLRKSFIQVVQAIFTAVTNVESNPESPPWKSLEKLTDSIW